MSYLVQTGYKKENDEEERQGEGKGREEARMSMSRNNVSLDSWVFS